MKITESDIKWYGTEYGGFYVVPKMIKENTTAICAGIGEDISFDTQLMGLHNMKVIGVDPTIKSIKYIERLNFNNYELIKSALVSSKVSGKKISIFENKNPDWVSESIVSDHNSVGSSSRSVETVCLESIIEKNKNISLIKLDIEGAEYDVIKDFLSNKMLEKINCSHFCVEFHHHCCENFDIKDTESIVKMFSENGYLPITKNWKEVTFVKIT